MGEQFDLPTSLKNAKETFGKTRTQVKKNIGRTLPAVITFIDNLEG